MPESLPEPLQALVALLEPMNEGERRETLISYAEQVDRHAPKTGVAYDVVDVRKDPECTDAVGIHLRRVDGDRVEFAMELGPQVQTLTRALGVLLCRGLNGEPLRTVASIEPGFVARLVGTQLVQQRSRTIYYLLRRLQEACDVLLERGEAPS